MKNSIASFFLSFSHDTIIIPLVILGYIWVDKKIFYNAICLILFSIIFNFVLKNIFRVPLSPSINKQGFSFPSGHMQSSVVLYGWLLINTQNLIYRALIITLLICIGSSLIYVGYHNYFDILGAIFFAVLLIFAYCLLLSRKEKSLELIIFSCSTILIIYIAVFYGIVEHLWMAYYSIIGLITSKKVFAKYHTTQDLKNKILATVICFVAIFIIKAFFAIKFISYLPDFIRQIQWVIISFCIPFSPFIASVLNNRLRCNRS